LELLQTKLTFEGIDHPVTYQDYYENYHKIGVLGGIKKYTIGLPGILIGVIKGKDVADKGVSNSKDDIIRITEKQEELFKQLSEQISISFNDKDGYIDLSVKMPEATAAAQLTKKTQTLLQNMVTSFKVEKAENQLQFIENSYEEAEGDFKRKQAALAYFQDNNQSYSSARSQTRLANLQADYNLAFGVYSELAKQVETQKIQVKEDTPVFTIVEPVSVPNLKSKPNRPMIVIIWLFLGFIAGIGIVFGEPLLTGLKVKMTD